MRKWKRALEAKDHSRRGEYFLNPVSDFLSDAGFLNLEKFSATGKVQSTEIAVMAGHAPKS